MGGNNSMLCENRKRRQIDLQQRQSFKGQKQRVAIKSNCIIACSSRGWCNSRVTVPTPWPLVCAEACQARNPQPLEEHLFGRYRITCVWPRLGTAAEGDIRTSRSEHHDHVLALYINGQVQRKVLAFASSHSSPSA